MMKIPFSFFIFIIIHKICVAITFSFTEDIVFSDRGTVGQVDIGLSYIFGLPSVLDKVTDRLEVVSMG